MGFSRRFLLVFIFLVSIVGFFYSAPHFLVDLLSILNPKVIFQFEVNDEVRLVGLTIDDFPNSRNLSISEEILNVLRRFDVRSTFFVIGSNVEVHRPSLELNRLFERIENEGHELGNHGWRDEQASRLDDTQLENQIRRTEQILRNFSKKPTRWFRPGSGFFHRPMIELCHRLGYRLVLGSIYPHDPQISNPKLNSFFIQSKLHQGGIIILHDRPSTISTLNLLLPKVKEKSFRLTSLTELESFIRTEKTTKLAKL